MKRRKPQGPKGEPTTEQKHGERKEESTIRHVYVEPGVEIDLVQDLKQKYETASTEANAHNNRQLLWAKISAGLIFVYAGLTFWQACTTRDILNTTRDQFQRDQRPYVIVEGCSIGQLGVPKSQIVVGQPFGVDVHFKNVGKTPALNVLIHRHVVFGEENVDQIRQEPIDTRKTGTALAQGNQGEVTAVSLKDTLANESMEINPADIVSWDGRRPIVIFGRITYEDTAGNRYCTPYLQDYLATGTFALTDFITNQKTHHTISVTGLCPDTYTLY